MTKILWFTGLSGAGKSTLSKILGIKLSKLSFKVKIIDGDIFRRVRKDKTLGETLTFMRDHDGKIIKIERHGNFSSKIIR